jgi:hypothetical protein
LGVSSSITRGQTGAGSVWTRVGRAGSIGSPLARASISDIGAAERAVGHPLPTLLRRCCSNWVTAVSVADRQQRFGALNLIRFRFHRLSRDESAHIRNHLRSIRLLDEPRVSTGVCARPSLALVINS